MQISSIILLITFLMQSPSPDFSITLSYHPAPFYYQEWFITIARIESKAYIETNSPQYLRKKCSIPLDEYTPLINKLVSLGIWQCKDVYTQGSYYLLAISKSNYRHQCKIEYSPSLTSRYNYNQIIRLIIQTAHNYLQ